MSHSALTRGFTLIEVLVALLIMALLALMSYRGLAAVLDARAHVNAESGKWRRVATFMARFERDVQLAAPRSVRTASGSASAWVGRPDEASGARLELSRFASAEGVDAPRRVGYSLNGQQEVELWLWAGLDAGPATLPARYPVLGGVARLDLEYLSGTLVWVGVWPYSPGDTVIPRAVRLSIVLVTGEEIVRVIALGS